ncbi:hypothetical protein LUZ61_018222 [Rhynchospora tenuis]|uniref:KIB1-4 beta-propeller domain-containing protein n=1 Tax=Rhynchospora tenuis TaxID=198213 RepID=A0AAD6ELR1_9POAL|nr:hypothetical protein LUZ61_018222 [Rhynchospora tenuis]
MESLSSTFPDWAHLPLLIVQLISEKMKSITDYVRFRAVCSPWRSASLPKPLHLPPQLPWLAIPHRPDKSDEDDGIRLFYDIWEGKMHKLHLPETIGMMCCASYRGWLLLVNSVGCEMFLLNPLSRACIQLPPFGAPVKHLGDDWDAPWPDHLPECIVFYYEISNVCFSSDLTDPNCMIIMFVKGGGFFCCQVGDPCWTKIKGTGSPITFGRFEDAKYCNGRFYLLYQRAMVIIESNKPEIVCHFEQLGNVHFSFLEGKSGIYVVAVCKSQEQEEGEDDTPKFQLYHWHEQQFELKKISDTSNTTFFFFLERTSFITNIS